MDEERQKRRNSSINNLKPVQPGEVRNKFGRAGKDGMGGKTKESLKRLLESKLNEIDPTTGKSQSELIIDVLIRNAKRGDFKYLDMVFDRTVGKAPQYVEQNITGDSLISPVMLYIPKRDDDISEEDGNEKT